MGGVSGKALILLERARYPQSSFGCSRGDFLFKTVGALSMARPVCRNFSPRSKSGRSQYSTVGAWAAPPEKSCTALVMVWHLYPGLAARKGALDMDIPATDIGPGGVRSAQPSEGASFFTISWRMQHLQASSSLFAAATLPLPTSIPPPACAALNKMQGCLCPGGALVIGSHESLPEGQQGFTPLLPGLGIFRRGSTLFFHGIEER